MSAITTHVLNTATGRPAANIAVVLQHLMPDGNWRVIGGGATDDDGRLLTLLAGDFPLVAGDYCLTFETPGISSFYPKIGVQFTIQDPAQHYHVPLLLSPFGYSTYRGS